MDQSQFIDSIIHEIKGDAHTIVKVVGRSVMNGRMVSIIRG
jgi:hypothetical protein